MPPKRRPQPRRRKPTPHLRPVMQDTWPETVLNEPEPVTSTSPLVWLTLALFGGAIIWAMLPARRSTPLPTLSAPAQRAMVAPARQSAAAAPKPAKAPAPDKAVRRADAGAPKRKAAAPTLAPTIPAWAKPEPKITGAPVAAARPSVAAPLATKAPVGAGHSVRAWRPEAGMAELAVFGPRNRRLVLLRSEAGPAGWVKLSWNGKDESGAKAPKGLYYLRPSVKSEQTVEEVWLE